jgi:hypothetical protein
MNLDSQAYAPYFRNGRLYLPEKTVTLLIEGGLAPHIAESALRGLALDTDRQQIAEINRTLEAMLGDMEEDSQEFRALTSDEAQFMLTGKPATRA